MPASKREMTTRLTVAACSVLFLALGCARVDQNALLVTGTDSVVVVAPLATPAFKNPPTGSAGANRLELVSFDPAALDAFGRQTPLDSPSQWPYFGRWFGDAEWSFGSALGVEAIMDAASDPRLPTLQGAFSFDDHFLFITGNGFGISNNFFGEFCCVGANERVVMGWARYGLTVNGALDHEQVLQGQAVDQPDELFLLGGSEGGDPLRTIAPFAGPYPTQGGANPLIWGFVDADGTGYVEYDVILDPTDAAGTLIWQNSGDPDNAYLAPNQQVRHNLPQYNYMVVYGTNMDGSVDYNRPLLRMQMATDLSSLGGPINNSYAPFPTAPLTNDDLALGNGAVSRPDSVTLTLDNLKEMAGTAAYQVWAIMGDGSASSLDFLYTPPGGSQAPATSFTGGEGEHEIVVEFPDAATDIVVSIEGSAGATSISDAQVIWSPGLQEAGSSKTTDLDVLFGTFSESRTWAISGGGRGGLFGDELRYQYQQLPRPPVGYKFVGWLSSGDTMFTRLPDATFTTPPGDGYQVLTDADIDTGISDFVQPAQIIEAMTKICVTAGEQGCFDLSDYDTFILGLEPKAGIMSEPGPTRNLTGTLPAQ